MSDEFNRRNILKNLATAGAITVSPAAASGSRTNKEDVLNNDIVQDILETVGNPEIEDIYRYGVKKLKDPDEKLVQRAEVTKVITSNGEFKHLRAVGGTKTKGLNNGIDINDGDVGVVYTFDKNIWESKRSGRDPVTHNKLDRVGEPPKRNKKLPKKFENSPSQIYISAEQSAEGTRKQIMREATNDEKEALLRKVSSPEDPVLTPSENNQDTEIQLEDLPIIISITDNKLMFGDGSLEFGKNIDVNQSVGEIISQEKFASDNTFQPNGGCGCWNVGLFDSGPCPTCAATHGACAGSIASCVASFGLTCLSTLSCAASSQVCACCVICIDDPACRHPC